MRKTNKPINTMPSATAVMNFRMNMTVLKNVSMVSNITDGKCTMTKMRENGNISARVVRSEKNEGM